MKTDWTFIHKEREIGIVISANGLFEAMAQLVLVVQCVKDWQLKEQPK